MKEFVHTQLTLPEPAQVYPEPPVEVAMTEHIQNAFYKLPCIRAQCVWKIEGISFFRSSGGGSSSGGGGG